ncbi:hypothetical protein FBU59_006298, partial [Linderina macrospora]
DEKTEEKIEKKTEKKESPKEKTSTKEELVSKEESPKEEETPKEEEEETSVKEKSSETEVAPKEEARVQEVEVEEVEEVEEEVEKPRVRVYGSTVSGNRIYKKQIKDLFLMLEANEIEFEFVCIAADQAAKRWMKVKSLGNMTIPQIHVDGELKGYYEDAFKANEVDELYEWLGLDEDPVDF